MGVLLKNTVQVNNNNRTLRWLNMTVGVDTSHVTECEQILGLSKLSKDSDIINMVLLRACFVIYRQRLFHKCNLFFFFFFFFFSVFIQA